MIHDGILSSSFRSIWYCCFKVKLGACILFKFFKFHLGFQNYSYTFFSLSIFLYFSRVFTESHQSSSRILQDNQTSKGKSNAGHKPSHGKSGWPTSQKSVAPRCHGNSSPLQIITGASGLDAVINRRAWFDKRIFRWESRTTARSCRRGHDKLYNLLMKQIATQCI